MVKQFTNQELQQIQQDFLVELRKASLKEPSSLSFIEHELPKEPLVKEGETFQVIVIGGSVFKKALMKKNNNEIVLLSKEEKQQPPFNTKDDLFMFFANEIDPHITKVGLNFAYPLEPVFHNGKLDGKLIRGVKENRFEGLIEQLLCEEIERYMRSLHEREIVVSVANDTVCLLLSGLTLQPSRNLVGGIVGTGMNFAIFANHNTLANLEAANFNKFAQSEEGMAIDKASNKPGEAVFEKEISGAYLYQQFNYFASKMSLSCDPLTSTKQLDELAQNLKTEQGTIAINLLMKSASLAACAIGSIVLFKKQDLTFIMEGSLYWDAKGYKEQVEKTLSRLITNHHVAFSKVEDSALYGGAKLIS